MLQQINIRPVWLSTDYGRKERRDVFCAYHKIRLGSRAERPPTRHAQDHDWGSVVQDLNTAWICWNGRRQSFCTLQKNAGCNCRPEGTLKLRHQYRNLEDEKIAMKSRPIIEQSPWDTHKEITIVLSKLGVLKKAELNKIFEYVWLGLRKTSRSRLSRRLWRCLRTLSSRTICTWLRRPRQRCSIWLRSPWQRSSMPAEVASLTKFSWTLSCSRNR